MTIAKDTEAADILQSESDDFVVPVPPGNLYSNEPALETYLHLQQLLLLLKCLDWFWQDRNDYFAAGILV
jgi:Uma2 family endonuclease